MQFAFCFRRFWEIKASAQFNNRWVIMTAAATVRKGRNGGEIKTRTDQVRRPAAMNYLRFSKVGKVSKAFVKKHQKFTHFEQFAFLTSKMTSKLKFDLIRPTMILGCPSFLFDKLSCLSTPWTFNLQFKSCLVVFLELIGHRRTSFCKSCPDF